jgi:hypothetical protein
MDVYLSHVYQLLNKQVKYQEDGMNYYYFIQNFFFKLVLKLVILLLLLYVKVSESAFLIFCFTLNVT